jgi:DNA polymerase-3 subunit beta
MKFSCVTSNLLQALHLAGRAIGAQQALPILGNVLLEAEGKRCTFSATDLELSIITSLEAKVENEGSVAIPVKAILNFAQYNTDTEVLLETIEGTQLRCTSKHARTLIAGEPASEYPTISGVEKQTSLTLAAEPFIEALHLVTFASAKSSMRPVLSGVHIRTEKGKLVLVATDSYRLSEYKIPSPKIDTDISCIIPAKILEELKAVLGARRTEKEKKVDSTLEVILSKQQVEFQIGMTRLLSRLIDGKFPNYEQIIPQNTVTTAQFRTSELITATRRMHYFAKEVNNNLTFHLSHGQARIVTPQTQIGRDEALLTTDVNGKENKIALSSSYLLDFLNHIERDQVEMSMTDSVHPAVFSIPSEKAFLHLIMPLRMQEEEK